MASTFTTRFITIPPSLYFGTDGSVSLAAKYPSGVPYILFTPDAAKAALLGNKYRLIIACPGTGSAYTTGTDSGAQMLEVNNVGKKLGWGTDNAGTGNAPDANWPTLYAFYQNANSWTGTGPNRDTRVLFVTIDAILDDLCANFNIDRTRIYMTGHSGGSGTALEYIYGRAKWPSQFRYDIAGALLSAGTYSGSGFRGDLPDMVPGENSTNQTCPKIARDFTKFKVPQWWCNSVSDVAVGPTTGGAYRSLATDNVDKYDPPTAGVTVANITYRQNSQWFHRTEYLAPLAYGHPECCGATFGNDAVSGAMVYTDPRWAWLLSQQSSPRARIKASTSLFSFAGATATVTPSVPVADATNPAITTLFMRQKRVMGRG